MATSVDADAPFDKVSNDASIERSLRELHKLREKIVLTYEKRFELFDFGLVKVRRTKEPNDKELERLIRACGWHAMALKTEFGLKLLYSIDGDPSAVESRNPVSTFLLARYLLELVATVNAIDSQLKSCLDMDLRDWALRGTLFMLLLFRARYSTSDEKVKSGFVAAGYHDELLKPISISKAIKMLTSKPNFHWAHSEYGTLSNICHHNGSGHRLFVDRIRETNALETPGGAQLFLKDKTWAMTLRFPVSGLALKSLRRTAEMTSWNAHCTNEMLAEMPEVPFTDRELRKLTDGRLKRTAMVDISVGVKSSSLMQGAVGKPGRNDPCPCGSGKKYKHCCWTKWN